MYFNKGRYSTSSIKVYSEDEFNLVQEALLSSKPYHWTDSRKMRIIPQVVCWMSIKYIVHKKKNTASMDMYMSFYKSDKRVNSSLMKIREILKGIE